MEEDGEIKAGNVVEIHSFPSAEMTVERVYEVRDGVKGAELIWFMNGGPSNGEIRRAKIELSALKKVPKKTS